MKVEIDDKLLLNQITTEISQQIRAQAEPVIQQAIKDFEKQMRERVAVIAMAQAEKWCEVTRDRNVVNIRINMGSNNGPY
jgi:F0F1-type ATP synthase membrane subunit b/b'